MGAVCTTERPEFDDYKTPKLVKNDPTRLSIFEDLGNDDKIKEKSEYKFANEYKVGPYIIENSDKLYVKKDNEIEKHKKKNQKWKNMYNQQINKVNVTDLNDENNGFVLTKLEKFLVNYKERRTNSFYEKLEQGPPEVLRWSTWKATLQINEYFQKGLYETFIGTDEFDQETKDQINRDITRTFPKQFYFNNKEQKGMSLGHFQLERILFGISNYFPKLGYCQGMNFTLGFLLLISAGKEIDVFWAFIALIRNPKYLVMGLYEQEMPLLHFMEYLTEYQMKKNMPKLYQRLKDLEVQNSFWLTKWYMTLFLYNFPISICQRIWDYMLVEGTFGLVSMVIPILKIFENEFYVINEVEVFEYFQQITRNEDELEIEGCPHYMNMDRITTESKQYLLPRKKIASLAKEFLQTHKNQEGFQNSLKIYEIYDKEQEFNQAAKEMVEKQTMYYIKVQQGDIRSSSDNSEPKSRKSTRDMKKANNKPENKNGVNSPQASSSSQQQQQKQQPQNDVRNNSYSQQNTTDSSQNTPITSKTQQVVNDKINLEDVNLKTNHQNSLSQQDQDSSNNTSQFDQNQPQNQNQVEDHNLLQMQNQGQLQKIEEEKQVQNSISNQNSEQSQDQIKVQTQIQNLNTSQNEIQDQMQTQNQTFQQQIDIQQKESFKNTNYDQILTEVNKIFAQIVDEVVEKLHTEKEQQQLEQK